MFKARDYSNSNHFDSVRGDMALALHSQDKTKHPPDKEADQDGQREEQRGGPAKEHGGDDGVRPKKRSEWPFVILAIMVLLAIVGGVIYYVATRNEISTDDAYTEGRAISMAAKVSGYVTALLVDDNTRVKAGGLLLQIDRRDYAIARDQAQADLATAEAQLRSAQVQLQQAQVRAPANLQQAQAQLDWAHAN